MARKLWTEAEIERLIQLYIKDNLPGWYVGEKLGRTKTSVQRKCAELGLRKHSVKPDRPSAAQEKRRMMSLYSKGVPVKQIGRMLARSEGWVRDRVARWGLPPRPVKTWPQWGEAQVERLIQLWNEERRPKGYIADVMSREFGHQYTGSSIVGKVHRLGLERRPSPIIRTGPSEETKRRRQRTETNKKLKETLKIEERDGRRASDEGFIVCAANGRPENGKGCQWLEGDPKDRNFCGRPVKKGAKYPWCEEHHARVYQKPTAKQVRAWRSNF